MGKTNCRIGNLEKKVNQLATELHSFKKESNERYIVDKLRETDGPFNKPRYVYEEIANMAKCSPSYVSKVASENGLSRRSIKKVD
ncbi:hypothetical protein [Neobacillus drentensis]|uniref:hypothetical protein n=1 Tax=Neobacillus drentensis TaxID=220684 RepID=UPI0030009C7A